MSIREVAARAGVSPATVSRVFTQPDAVAADTRRRVLEVAGELNYVPNPVARSLARGRTGNLGIVVPDMANAFSAVIAKAVQQEARRDGYALFVAGSDELAQDEEQWARAMAPQVDGLLLVSPLMPDAALRELAEQGPVVLVNRSSTVCPAVLTDATEATGHAVEHLHALGHRRIIYLAGPEGYSNSMRLRGYRAACARLGVEPLEMGPFQARFAAGVRAADQVLAAAATAVVAYNDEVAVGVMNRLGRPRGAGAGRRQRRRIRRHLAGRHGDAAADHRAAADGGRRPGRRPSAAGPVAGPRRRPARPDGPARRAHRPRQHRPDRTVISDSCHLIRKSPMKNLSISYR